MRPNFDTYFMGFARAASARATCPRASVGAVIVRDKQLISSGYNGAKSGEDHCTDIGCNMVDGHCVRAVHSELNAIYQCLRRGIDPSGAVIYCTHLPCSNCAREIVENGIFRVVFDIMYRPDGLSLGYLQENNVEVYQLCG